MKNEEIEFYKKIIGEDNEYLESNVPYESYKKIDKCKFVVFASSTLVESIARKPTVLYAQETSNITSIKLKMIIKGQQIMIKEIFTTFEKERH